MMSSPTVSCLLFLLGLALSGAVELLASQTTFILPTDDRLVLTCNGNNSTGKVTDLNLIRISKLENGRWQAIAQVRKGTWRDAIQVFQQGIHVTGDIGWSIQYSYMRVAWNETTHEEKQTYKCIMMGYSRRSSYVSEVSEEVTITERNATIPELVDDVRKQLVNLQDEFSQYKRDADQDRARLQTEIEQLQRNGTHNQTAQNIENVVSDLETRLLQEMRAAVAAVENRTCSRIASCQHLPLESGDSYNTSSPSMEPLFATPSISAEPSEATPPPSVRPRRATPPPSGRPSRPANNPFFLRL